MPEGDDDREGRVDELASLLSIDADFVRQLLPSPIVAVDIQHRAGVLWYAAGEPALVLVGVDGSTVSVAEPAIQWDGPHTPILIARRVVDLSREGVAAEMEDDLRRALAAEIKAARAARMRRFRTCQECGTRTPPEWLHSATLCSACAERNHGVVY